MRQPIARTEHPTTAIVLHWVHVVSFVVLGWTGWEIHVAREAGSHAAASASLHDTAAYVFVLSSILRFVWAFAGAGSSERSSYKRIGDWRHFVLGREDVRHIPLLLARYLGKSGAVPQARKYNSLQKIVYAALFPVCVIAVTITGLALSPQYSEIFGWLIMSLGGEEQVRSAHLLVSFGLGGLSLAHMYAAFREGVGRNLLMFFGVVPEKMRAPQPEGHLE